MQVQKNTKERRAECSLPVGDSKAESESSSIVAASPSWLTGRVAGSGSQVSLPSILDQSPTSAGPAVLCAVGVPARTSRQQLFKLARMIGGSRQLARL